MSNSPIVGRLFAVIVAFLTITLLGNNGASAQAATFRIAEWHPGLTSSAELIPRDASSDSVLGSAGVWRVSTSWAPVVEKPSIEIITGFLEIIDSSTTESYGNS